MRLKEEIKDSIRTSFPLVFSKVGSVPREFRAKFDATIDYLLAVSEPFLRPETVRYQSMLLYVTLVFLSLNLLRIGEIKLLEHSVKVDRELLVLYTIFIVTVAVVFLIKAFVDVKRAELARKKNADVIGEARHLIEVVVLKRGIQLNFWIETQHAIDRSYQIYDDAMSKVLPMHHVKYIPMDLNAFDPAKVHTWDFEKLRKEDPDLAREITTQENNLSNLTKELTQDENIFCEGADIILAQSTEGQQPGDEWSERLTSLYQTCLSNWKDAIKEVNEEVFSQVVNPNDTEENLEGEELLKTLRRTLMIRRIYAAVEIIAPVIFAIFGIVYVWLLPVERHP